MIVYKFKSLSDKSKAHTFDIIQNNRVYLEKWDKLNDPIEGYFSYWDEVFANELSSEKLKYRVCSFSKYFANTLLWSYYTEGFKDVCLVLQIDDAKGSNGERERTQSSFTRALRLFTGAEVSSLVRVNDR